MNAPMKLTLENAKLIRGERRYRLSRRENDQKYSQEDELPGYSGSVVGPRFSETGFGWITNNCPS